MDGPTSALSAVSLDREVCLNAACTSTGHSSPGCCCVCCNHQEFYTSVCVRVCACVCESAIPLVKYFDTYNL